MIDPNYANYTEKVQRYLFLHKLSRSFQTLTIGAAVC